MASVDQVKADVSRQVEGGDVVERLADGVGLRARVSAAYGDPVERAGVTVIPVARSVWGFGGGSGGDAANQGSGGGGGGLVSPIGFIEVREGDARFVPMRDMRLTALRLGLVAGLVGWVVRRRG